MVTQALIIVVLIAQNMCKNTAAAAGEVTTAAETKRTKRTGQTERTEQMEHITQSRESKKEIPVYRVSSIATRPFFLSNKSNINQ